MSNQRQIQQTQHAFLVAWGWFAEQIGLIQALQAVPLSQKRYSHTPQTKVVEFLVAILAGLEHLQDISLAAHPLDMDQAVAEAWGQPGWADYSGVSRTLSSLSWSEVTALVQVLERADQPLIQAELAQLGAAQQRLQYDGDLTGLPVSSSSRSYPNAAFGHMADEIQLGYQAAVVSLVSPTYRRLWLSAAHHPGDTVSCSQAEALVLAAEARTGLRPRRRTELLRQRIEAFERQLKPTQHRLLVQQAGVDKAGDQLTQARQQRQQRQGILTDLEQSARLGQGKKPSASSLAVARRRLQATEGRCRRREKLLQSAQQRLTKTQTQWVKLQAGLKQLQERLARFERDNELNSTPVEAAFRLDAGFGAYDNIALLIELGYEVYTKAHNHRAVTFLKDRTDPQTVWTRVGANAEMTAWTALSFKHCPYPLDVGLVRFYTDQKLKHTALLHFGPDPVSHHLPDWFKHYNARQIIEAGIKEGKRVFQLHRLKVRAEPAIYLQERLVIFAANFIRWATHWLTTQAELSPNSLNLAKLGVKRQVQVGAHVSAQVIEDPHGKLLKFSQHSIFAGKVLKVRKVSRPVDRRSYNLMPFSNESYLIAQPLR